MSYEYKDLIAQSISEGEFRYAIEDEDYQDYREARLELDRVYAQAAKADEFEAKAEAFDLVVEERDSAGRTMASKQSLEQYAVVNAFWNIDEIIIDYESGECDVKK